MAKHLVTIDIPNPVTVAWLQAALGQYPPDARVDVHQAPISRDPREIGGGKAITVSWSA